MADQLIVQLFELRDLLSNLLAHPLRIAAGRRLILRRSLRRWAAHAPAIVEPHVDVRAVEPEGRELSIVIADRLDAILVHVGVSIQHVLTADGQSDVFSERDAKLDIE